MFFILFAFGRLITLGAEEAFKLITENLTAIITICAIVAMVVSALYTYYYIKRAKSPIKGAFAFLGLLLALSQNEAFFFYGMFKALQSAMGHAIVLTIGFVGFALFYILNLGVVIASMTISYDKKITVPFYITTCLGLLLIYAW